MGRPQSAETKAKISAARMGQPSPRKGVTLSAETRAKLSVAATGRRLTDAHKAKIGAASRGERNPFFGKKHTAESLVKMSAIHAGKEISAEQRAKMSAATRGRPKTAEHKAKIGASQVGKVIPPAARARISARQRARLAAMSAEQRANLPQLRAMAAARKLRHRPTSIEVAVTMVLDVLGIVHEREVQIGPYRVDVLIEDRRLVIECDGTYWHALPKTAARDKRKDAYLTGLGYRVVRLTETDIRSDARACVLEGLAG